MTDSNYTHLLTVVDRSGSMAPVAKDMIGGLNNFFAEQAEGEGKCLVDYSQFDTVYEQAFTDVPVSEAKAVLTPRGGTALLDAIGQSVTDLGEKLAAMPESERPGTVIVVVVTDGEENSSTEWKPEAVKALIKNQEDKYNWRFTFLGANIDAVSVGSLYGFGAGSSLTYNTANIGDTMSVLSAHTHRTRSGLKSVYTEEERAASLGNHSHS